MDIMVTNSNIDGIPWDIWHQHNVWVCLNIVDLHGFITPANSWQFHEGKLWYSTGFRVARYSDEAKWNYRIWQLDETDARIWAILLAQLEGSAMACPNLTQDSIDFPCLKVWTLPQRGGSYPGSFFRTSYTETWNMTKIGGDQGGFPFRWSQENLQSIVFQLYDLMRAPLHVGESPINRGLYYIYIYTHVTMYLCVRYNIYIYM